MISPHTTQKMAKIMLWMSALVSVLILFTIIGYVTINGIAMMSLDFLLDSPRLGGKEGGIFPAIVGTLYVVAMCLLCAVPVGIGAAIYLSEYAKDNFMTKTIRYGVDCLAGVPSIVIGLFGYAFLVYALGLGFSILSGGLALAFMILPWTVRTSEEAIKAVPNSYREASLALGATKWVTTRDVVLKSAAPWIITGIILGTGKALGETAVVLFTAGMFIGLPASIFDPARTLPVHLYLLASEGISFERAYGTALVLLALFLIINYIAIFVRNHYARALGG